MQGGTQGRQPRRVARHMTSNLPLSAIFAKCKLPHLIHASNVCREWRHDIYSTKLSDPIYAFCSQEEMECIWGGDDGTDGNKDGVDGDDDGVDDGDGDDDGDHDDGVDDGGDDDDGVDDGDGDGDGVKDDGVKDDDGDDDGDSHSVRRSSCTTLDGARCTFFVPRLFQNSGLSASTSGLVLGQGVPKGTFLVGNMITGRWWKLPRLELPEDSTVILYTIAASKFVVIVETDLKIIAAVQDAVHGWVVIDNLKSSPCNGFKDDSASCVYFMPTVVDETGLWSFNVDDHKSFRFYCSKILLNSYWNVARAFVYGGDVYYTGFKVNRDLVIAKWDPSTDALQEIWSTQKGRGFDLNGFLFGDWFIVNQFWMVNMVTLEARWREAGMTFPLASFVPYFTAYPERP